MTIESALPYKKAKGRCQYENFSARIKFDHIPDPQIIGGDDFRGELAAHAGVPVLGLSLGLDIGCGAAVEDRGGTCKAKLDRAGCEPVELPCQYRIFSPVFASPPCG